MKNIIFFGLALFGLWGCDNSSNKGSQANGSYDSSMTPDSGSGYMTKDDSLGTDSLDSLQRQPSTLRPE